MISEKPRLRGFLRFQAKLDIALWQVHCANVPRLQTATGAKRFWSLYLSPLAAVRKPDKMFPFC